MWDVLRDYTLEEPMAWHELAVRLSGTPDRYYQIEAHEREKRMSARGQGSARQSA
jgi:hypothetical protein